MPGTNLQQISLAYLSVWFVIWALRAVCKGSWWAYCTFPPVSLSGMREDSQAQGFVGRSSMLAESTGGVQKYRWAAPSGGSPSNHGRSPLLHQGPLENSMQDSVKYWSLRKHFKKRGQCRLYWLGQLFRRIALGPDQGRVSRVVLRPLVCPHTGRRSWKIWSRRDTIRFRVLEKRLLW